MNNSLLIAVVLIIALISIVCKIDEVDDDLAEILLIIAMIINAVLLSWK